MKIHEVHRGASSDRRPKKRVGRGQGSGNGKFAGKGLAGGQSRSGYAARRGAEGGQMPYFRRLPKRGFTNVRFKTECSVVNVGDLGVFDKGSTVSPAELFARGLVSKLHGLIKVLGRGELDRALTVRAQSFSRSAAEKIAKAGGKVELI